MRALWLVVGSAPLKANSMLQMSFVQLILSNRRREHQQISGKSSERHCHLVTQGCAWWNGVLADLIYYCSLDIVVKQHHVCFADTSLGRCHTCTGSQWLMYMYITNVGQGIHMLSYPVFFGRFLKSRLMA